MKKLWRAVVVFFCTHDYRIYKWLSAEQRMCCKCGDICSADDAVFR